MNFNKDKVAIVFSFLCGVHCILTPLVLLMPFVQNNSFLFDHHNHEFIHLILFLCVFPLSLTVVYSAAIKKINTLVLIASLGIVFLCLSAVNNFTHFFEHESYAEVILALAGSFFLIWAHLKNMSLKSCKKPV